jgi:hypothetical protein
VSTGRYFKLHFRLCHQIAVVLLASTPRGHIRSKPMNVPPDGRQGLVVVALVRRPSGFRLPTRVLSNGGLGAISWDPLTGCGWVSAGVCDCWVRTRSTYPVSHRKSLSALVSATTMVLRHLDPSSASWPCLALEPRSGLCEDVISGMGGARAVG